jgi:uncharacterized protein YnzC (UPF0291/DUF896 family)
MFLKRKEAIELLLKNEILAKLFMFRNKLNEIYYRNKSRLVISREISINSNLLPSTYVKSYKDTFKAQVGEGTHGVTPIKVTPEYVIFSTFTSRPKS